MTSEVLCYSLFVYKYVNIRESLVSKQYIVSFLTLYQVKLEKLQYKCYT